MSSRLDFGKTISFRTIEIKLPIESVFCVIGINVPPLVILKELRLIVCFQVLLKFIEAYVLLKV